jgi:hypothetical protein
MFKIQDRLLEEFAGAKIEDDYYRVGNIFYFLKAKRSFVHLQYADKKIPGRIVKVLDEKIRIYFPGYKESQERRGVITFEALNRYYMCEIFIINMEHEIVDIQYPEKLQFISRRLYPRVEFDDLFMRFITMYSQFFKSKEEERVLENSYPEFFQEIREDSPSLRVLYQFITGEVKKITTDFNVKMYHSQEILQFNNIVEQMVMGEGKVLLVEDTSSLSSYYREFDVSEIESFSGRYKEIESESGEAEAEKYVKEIQKLDINDFLLSYFALPIVIFNRPRGYFIMRTNQFDKKNISYRQAADIVSLFRVFSYAATKVKILSSYYDPMAVRTRIVNISMSGLLMEIQDATLYEYLKSNRRIKMMIPIMGEELEVYGEIIRFYAKDNYFYLGILFFKTRPGDIAKLEEYLHENRNYQFF